MLNLDQFNGGDAQYRHPLMRSVNYTEGAKYVADTAGAHWLLDVVASHQLDPKVKAEPFQVWKLEVTGSVGKVICEDGNDNVVTTQDIPFTDFPEPGVTLWFTGNVILLPSEY